jgi:hypothetical protein
LAKIRASKRLPLLVESLIYGGQNQTVGAILPRPLVALLNWIKSHPDLDADRVMVQGGGYLALADFNLVDKNEVAVVDMKARKVTARCNRSGLLSTRCGSINGPRLRSIEHPRQFRDQRHRRRSQWFNRPERDGDREWAIGSTSSTTTNDQWTLFATFFESLLLNMDSARNFHSIVS